MLTVILSSLPPSINHLYLTRGRYRVLTPEARKWKSAQYPEIKAQLQCQASALAMLRHKKLCLTMTVSKPNWLTKSGSIRKCDVENYSKAGIDTVFEEMRDVDASFDDSQIYTLIMNKIDGPEEVVIVIEKI
jgi:Holliday junction resolvase RusA-like endonuclease